MDRVILESRVDLGIDSEKELFFSPVQQEDIVAINAGLVINLLVLFIDGVEEDLENF